MLKTKYSELRLAPKVAPTLQRHAKFPKATTPKMKIEQQPKKTKK